MRFLEKPESYKGLFLEFYILDIAIGIFRLFLKIPEFLKHKLTIPITILLGCPAAVFIHFNVLRGKERTCFVRPSTDVRVRTQRGRIFLR